MKEIRAVNTEFEVKEVGEDDNTVINGYAAIFDSEAPETSGFIEKIAPGAFTNAIKKSDPFALFNHNMEKVLGRKSSGTLQLREDEKGLYYEVDPPDTTYANDLIESLKRGDINESSFGFIVAEEKWDDSGDTPVRTIVEVEELIDVSPVTRAWYPQTDSGLKSKKEVLKEYREKKKENVNREKEKLENYKLKLKTRRGYNG